MSRDKQDILAYVKDIFKSLEILNEIKVEEVSLETDESQFGPIKANHRYYKAITPSRLNKIHYKLRITPSEVVENVPLLEGKKDTMQFVENSETFIKEGDLFINKLIDNCFYINEGIRYFLIYQIVDNATYGNENSVSLKSLLMPITLTQSKITAIPEFGEDPIELPSYETLLFAKRLNTLMYVFAKESYNSLVKMKVKDPDNIIQEWQQYTDEKLIKKFNTFFGTDLKFDNDLNKLVEDNRIIFQIKSERDSGVYFSVDKEKLENDSLTRAVVGSLLNLHAEVKKKKIIFNYENLCRPWFWIEKTAPFFTKNTDPMKKFEKVKTMLISLSRLIDDATRKILNIKPEDKENTLSIMRYIMREFETLVKADNQDLDNKRLRLFEYQLFPLRKYFSDQIYRVLNSATRSKAVLDRMFSNLSPMYIIKQTVVNELLRYYNAANEIDIYSCLMKYTFKGPQSINKTVTAKQRDLHPSYTGRLSLIASSASDPGISGNLSPFVETYNGYFKKQEKVK